uniref:Uncharacterized protein n=1 Tax=viral metagenome TaxID=1070528 RepID=A0A6C0J3Q8_9ZZZZ
MTTLILEEYSTNFSTVSDKIIIELYLDIIKELKF